jgi:hypothetical protein
MTAEKHRKAARRVGVEPTTLVIRNRNVGFFSNFNAVVDNLVHRLGRDGIEAARVDWRAIEGSSQFPYGTATHRNLWDTFFEPLPFPVFPDRTIETDTFEKFTITGRSAYAAYKLKRRWRQQYHRAYARYVKPRRRLLDKVERIYGSRMDGHYCIGVHWRHSGHGEGPFPIPDTDVFVARVKKLVPKDRSWRVFLATDTQTAVADFDSAFNDRLVVQAGAARTQSTSESQLHHGHESPSTALGEDVLVDCLLLARCDAMLHVTSNVATAAGYINPDMKMIYCETPQQAVIGYPWAIRRTFRSLHRYRFRAFRVGTGAVD